MFSLVCNTKLYFGSNNYKQYKICIITLWYARLRCASSFSHVLFANPWTVSPPGSSVHGNSPGKNSGVGCHFLLQGIFPTQGLNPGLPNCRQILYHLSHHGSILFSWAPKSLQMVTAAMKLKGTCPLEEKL